MFFKHLHDLSDLAVIVGDFSEVVAEVFSNDRRIDDVGRKFDLFRRISRCITLVPWRMWLVGTGEQTETFRTLCAFREQFFDRRHVRIILFGGMLVWAVVSVITINRAGPWANRPAAGPMRNDIIAFGVSIIVMGGIGYVHGLVGPSVFGG